MDPSSFPTEKEINLFVPLSCKDTHCSFRALGKGEIFF